MRLGIDDRTISRTLVSLTLGAVILRLLTFIGRGDYVAFDEGWYLLLGQSFWSGGGYQLTGLRHTTLSPLFPILAGGVGRLVGDPIWGGRIVAAITSGLLVLPCWSIFHRLAGRRTAVLACVIVALTPSLAPFLAPEVVGWDLWVGAEPVYHLFLYTGIALTLRAVDRQGWGDWALAGGSFSLAYLARPEAVIAFGLVGLLTIAHSLISRKPRHLIGPIFGGLAFVLVAAPYLLYLRDATGHWTLTGRAVQVRPASGQKSTASRAIEQMLWQGRHGGYVRVLFALDSTSTRLANGYWGVPRVREEADVLPTAIEEGETAGSTELSADLEEARVYAADSVVAPAGATLDSNRHVFYFAALNRILPAVLVPFIIFGMLAPRRRYRASELFFVVPLVATSLLIARVVAIDPRTQLFLVPALLFYAARGARYLGVTFDSRVPSGVVRAGLIPKLLVIVVVAALAAESMQRLYLSLRVETTYKFLAAENRRAGEELRRIVPEGHPIMSWHPAIALHARRDWRVLPLAPLVRVIRYANATESEYVALSIFNPSPMPPDKMAGPYQLLHVPPASADAGEWRIELIDVRNGVAVSRLVAQ